MFSDNYSICHTDIIPQEDIIPNEKITVKGIGTELIKLPMAKVHIKYEEWTGKFKVAISDQIHTPCLTGLDLINCIKTDVITTH